MKKLLMIGFVAMFVTIACKEETPPPPPQLPDVTITGPTWIWVDEKGTFTATLSEAAQEIVTIKLTNTNPSGLILAAEEIVIEKGQTVGKVDFTAKLSSIGGAKVSFASTDATVKTPELFVQIITGDPPVSPEYPQFENGTFSAISKIVIGEYTFESSAANSPDGANGLLGGNDDFGIGSVCDDKTKMPFPVPDGVSYTIYYDNYTADNGIEMAVALYVDWYGEWDFAGPGAEVIVEKGIPANAKKEISGTIHIPEGAAKSARIRVMCYAVEGNTIKNGVGLADSGYLMELMYSNE